MREKNGLPKQISAHKVKSAFDAGYLALTMTKEELVGFVTVKFVDKEDPPKQLDMPAGPHKIDPNKKISMTVIRQKRELENLKNKYVRR